MYTVNTHCHENTDTESERTRLVDPQSGFAFGWPHCWLSHCGKILIAQDGQRGIDSFWYLIATTSRTKERRFITSDNGILVHRLHLFQLYGLNILRFQMQRLPKNDQRPAEYVALWRSVYKFAIQIPLMAILTQHVEHDRIFNERNASINQIITSTCFSWRSYRSSLPTQ